MLVSSGPSYTNIKYTSVLSSPVLQPRDTVSSVTSIIQSLLADVKSIDTSINSTSTSISSSSTAADKLAAEASISEAINALAARIVEATTATKSLVLVKKRTLEERQTDLSSLAGSVYALLVEISSTLNGVITAVGLSGKSFIHYSYCPPASKVLTPSRAGLIGGSLGPLVASLSALLLALESVVDNLLALVKELLDGLLTGLSAALAGLVI